MEFWLDLQDAIIDGLGPVATELAEQGLRDGLRPTDFFPEAIVPAMDEVGHRMSTAEYFIPEVLKSARAVRAVADVLRPLLAGYTAAEPLGTVALGAVKGDLHDIGKNIVGMLLEGAGFKVLDLGTDVGPDRFVRAVRDEQANIIAMTALLTTTMVNMKTTIKALEDAGVREKVKIMVGGAPVTENWARAIGADGYERAASGAVALARRFVDPTRPVDQQSR